MKQKIMKKFKKYPAVTLHEDINPTPAYWIENGFSPVMHQYARDLSEKNERELMPYFFDARDDVIEVICAELFALASRVKIICILMNIKSTKKIC